jgi:hypothetical protein
LKKDSSVFIMLATELRGRKGKRKKSNVGIDGVTAIGLILWFVEFWISPTSGDRSLTQTYDTRE